MDSVPPPITTITDSRRTPKVLFASYHCYYDPASGAAVCTRDLFAALSARGWRCGVFTGPLRDDPGAPPIREQLRNDPAVHTITGTVSTTRFFVFSTFGPGRFPITVFAPDRDVQTPRPTREEATGFLTLLADVMRRFQPDIVLTYGGDEASLEIASIAHRLSAKSAFWLHNFSYPNKELFQRFDAVVVPSRFSQEYHRETLGIDCVALAPIIDETRIRIDQPTSGRFVTFVNPIPEKGVYLFARLAEVLGRDRPDIPLLVVEGRGRVDWLGRCGVDLSGVRSLSRHSNTSDPRRFYQLTRLVLMPSVGYESFGRMAAEALLNGIGVLASDRGALPEVIGTHGVCLSIPTSLQPDTRVPPSQAEIQHWIDQVIGMWDDDSRNCVLPSASQTPWHPMTVIGAWESFFSQLAESAAPNTN